MFQTNPDIEIKPDVDINDIKVEQICRCCLSTNRQMVKIDNLKYLFVELADIFITEMDGLPQDICCECTALLRKSVRFKKQVLKAQAILYDYHNRCAPFAIDGKDPELLKYSKSNLTETKTLIINTSSTKNKLGFHTVLKHEKQIKKSLLDNVQLELSQNNDDDWGLDVKNEDPSNFDDLSMHEDYDGNKDTEDSLDKGDDKEEKTTERKRRIKNKNDVKEDSLDVSQIKKRKTRSKVDIDETKIRIVRLDPAEQLKQKEEECKSTLMFPFICHLCFKGFIYESKLQNHMKKHSPLRGSFKCEICSMYLPTNYSLSVHTLIHTRRFECKQCGRRMIDKDSIINHYRSEHEGITTVFTCHICGKIFSNNKTLRGHIRNTHTLSRVKCDECGKTLVNSDALAEHKLIHEGIKNHSCPVCGKSFRTRQQVRYHQSKHSDAKDYYCVECDTRFKTSQALAQHLKKSVKHKDEQSLLYQCNRCGKRFETESALGRHLSVQHDGVRPYPCPSCPAALATRSSLQKHIKVVHSGVKVLSKHVCDTCGRVFNAKSTLTNHMRTHTGEKPYPCERCGRKFAQRTAMRTHIKLVHLKLHRAAKLKPKQPDIVKYKEESPVVFEWPRQANCEYFTVTAGP